MGLNTLYEIRSVLEHLFHTEIMDVLSLAAVYDSELIKRHCEYCKFCIFENALSNIGLYRVFVVFFFKLLQQLV